MARTCRDDSLVEADLGVLLLEAGQHLLPAFLAATLLAPVVARERLVIHLRLELVRQQRDHRLHGRAVVGLLPLVEGKLELADTEETEWADRV